MTYKDDDFVYYIATILGIAALLGFVILLSGCGTSRDSETRTVERLQTSTGPVVIDTPIGQIHVQPVRHEMIRSQTEVSTEQTRIHAPEVDALVGAVGSGTPWGAIAGVGGMIAAAFAGKKALDYKRHRDEVIDGVERGAKDMDDAAWEKMRMALEAEQSNDTKKAVKARVG